MDEAADDFFFSYFIGLYELLYCDLWFFILFVPALAQKNY